MAIFVEVFSLKSENDVIWLGMGNNFWIFKPSLKYTNSNSQYDYGFAKQLSPSPAPDINMLTSGVVKD